MRVAVVGSGAAAVGVLAGLRDARENNTDVTLVDIGKTLSEPPIIGFDDADIKAIYTRLREGGRWSFPPPKSHFGEQLPKFQTDGKPRLWRSEHHGGLTNIWGGGMFPFTDRELTGWPISAGELEESYRRIADQVGVCGSPDHLDDYFGASFINRPPLVTSPAVHRLVDTVNSGSRRESDWTIIAGSSRLALETRTGLATSCEYTGECMLGCPRQAVWSASRDIDDALATGVVSRHVRAKVRRFVVRGREPTLEVEASGRRESLGPFDKVFIAAGCIGSTEIMMRSFELQSGPRMLDNAVLSFPIIYSGPLPAASERYFSLCNASMVGLPRDPAVGTAQVSIYPSFDHLWRFYTPSRLWSGLRGAWRAGRWRFLLGRVFFGGAANRTFSFHREGDDTRVTAEPPPERRAILSSFMRELRAAANRNGFYIPPVPPTGQATSSHYAGTFPYGSDVSRSGRVAPGVHLVDASTWVTAPAISPTFTIMANACRSTREALEE